MSGPDIDLITRRVVWTKPMIPTYDGEDDVHDRQTLLLNWIQNLILMAMISVVGQGGLGLEYAIQMGRMGVHLLELCDGDNVVFTAPAGNDDYVFYNGSTPIPAGGSNTYSTSSLALGNSVSVVVTALGCQSDTSSSISLIVNPLPSAAFNSDTVCGGDATGFLNTSVGITGLIWDFDGYFSDTSGSTNYIFTSSGSHSVTLAVYDVNGCRDSITQQVMVNSVPTASFTPNPIVTSILNPLITFTDYSTGDSLIDWQWSFGDNGSGSIQNPLYEYSDTGTYLVELMVTNKYGCTDTFTVTVIIEPEYTIHIPNTFTPNGDGSNDVFPAAVLNQFPGIGLEREFEMYILNRWGDVIFETKDISRPWDGKVNNGSSIAQEDVYVWIIYTRDHKDRKHKYLGHVTLIR